MKNVLSAILIFTTAFTFAQTDIIEMKSRNASLKNYSKLRGSDWYHPPSNFGNPPEIRLYEIKPFVMPPKVILDSVKKIEDDRVIFFTREQCEKSSTIHPIDVEPCPTKADTILHPLFRSKAPMDSIATIFRREYSMGLNVDSTEFIDFDTTNVKHSEEFLQTKEKQKENSIGWELIFMIVTPIALLFGMNKLKLIS